MFGYVVLHYQNYEITKECINKLLLFNKEEPIVVVDNCSPNNSGKKLMLEYSNSKNIDVVINKANEGFAKGNNVGYIYLKSRYPDVDYIVVMNNDIMIDDISFKEKIQNFMIKNELDVCGPDMITLNGNHQNPLQLNPNTTKYLKKRILKDKLQIILFRNNMFWDFYEKYKENHSPKIRKKQPSVFNCILHGSCIIYGSRFIDNEDFAFLPITYMYNEEAILYDYLKYKNYKTGYCSNISILHIEGVSTSTRTVNKKNKIIFRFENNIKSLEAQLKERKKYI